MKADVPAKANGTARVHNVRFYTIKPRAINCMAYNPQTKYLAVGRDDGSIELWDMTYAPYMDRVIQLTPEAQVENMAWAGKRLFSVDLTGKLIEWDLDTLQPRNEVAPTGNALWCLDVNSDETELAVGSEEGHINLLSIEQGEINYKLLFRKQEGRVLCCKFDKPGQRLVTGSVGAVRIWSVANGHVLHTMSLSSKNVIVYALQVLSDNTIITGDSAGFVTVWNANNGTQRETCKVLDRNVFALALNQDEDRLVCSGMDPPLIRVLSKTKIKREHSSFDRWIKFLQRDVHTHYVKALVIIGERVISGGQDGLLCMSSSTKTHGFITKLIPYVQGKSVSIAPSNNLMLLRYPQHLHLWRLGAPRPMDALSLAVGGSEQMQLETPPLKLLELVVGANKFIQAAAISPDGHWICYSTCTELRLNRLKSDPLSVQRLTEDLPAELEPAHFIIFNKTTELRLYLLHAAKQRMSCFRLDDENDEVNFLYSLDMSDDLEAPANLMELSSCGKYLVVSSCNHNVVVWLMRGKKPKHLVTLPHYKAAATAITFHENSPRLVIAYADAHIAEYDLRERRFTVETLKYFVNSGPTNIIRGLVLDPRNPDIVIVYDEMHFYVIETMDPDSVHRRLAKAKKHVQCNATQESNLTKNYSLKMERKQLHLLHVCRLNEDELVTIGVQLKNYLAPLPDPYQRKKFGAG